MVASGDAGTRVDELLAALAAHAAVDLEALDRGGLQAEFRVLARGRAWLDARHGLLTRLLQRLAEDEASIFPEADIANASNTSRREADQAARRAEALGAVPALDAALEAGEVSAAQVDAMGRALKRLKGDQRDALAADGSRLAAIAARSTPEAFEKRLRREVAALDEGEGGDRLERQRRANRLRSWTDSDTGMIHLKGEFDPETGLLMIGALENAVEAIFHGGVPDTCPDGEGRQDHLRALALAALVTRRDGAGNVDETDGAEDGTTDPWAPNADIVSVGDRAEMIVAIDLHTIMHGLHARSLIDNGHDLDLSVESYRRMACTAAIIPLVLNGDGVALDEGRQKRLANRAQRRALRAMYRRCAIPGCRVRSKHCEPHHVDWWEHLGPTNLSNLLPLCSRHHHAVHEGGWKLVLHADRSLTITYPDGTVQHSGPPIAQAA